MDIVKQFIPEIAGIIRHALTTGGGALVASGLISADQLNQGVGAIMVLIGLAWSIYQKQAAKE